MSSIVCPAAVPTQGFDAAVAEMRAYESFRADFLRRHRSGVVMTQYEYMSKGSFAGAGGTPLRIPSQPQLNALLDSMSDNFRRHVKFADFRKPDGIAMAERAGSVLVELLEVTTAGNALSAKKQMVDKTAILLGPVAKAAADGGLLLEVKGTPWRPGKTEEMTASTPTKEELARWVCYAPTTRLSPPAGVTLYEMHSVKKGTALPVFSPQAQQALQKSYASSKGAAKKGLPIRTPDPVVAQEIANMLTQYGPYVVVGATALACAATALSPVPGDEVVVCGFALGVTRAALR
jgi:hypothetical protein